VCRSGEGFIRLLATYQLVPRGSRAGLLLSSTHLRTTGPVVGVTTSEHKYQHFIAHDIFGSRYYQGQRHDHNGCDFSFVSVHCILSQRCFTLELHAPGIDFGDIRVYWRNEVRRGDLAEQQVLAPEQPRVKHC
jgi:hypothetical protein